MASPLTQFTQAQAQEPLWRRLLKPQLMARLEEYRTELERPTSNAESTASLRGKVALIREILALETDPATARRQPAASHPDE